MAPWSQRPTETHSNEASFACSRGGAQSAEERVEISEGISGRGPTEANCSSRAAVPKPSLVQEAEVGLLRIQGSLSRPLVLQLLPLLLVASSLVPLLLVPSSLEPREVAEVLDVAGRCVRQRLFADEPLPRVAAVPVPRPDPSVPG